MCGSKLFVGAAKVHFEERSTVRQRPPLTGAQAKTLEQTVINPKKSNYDRIMAGYFLMLLMEGSGI